MVHGGTRNRGFDPSSRSPDTAADFNEHHARMQPTGTVTLLFTDIEGSTRLLAAVGVERYEHALDQHRALLRQAFAPHGAYEVSARGDALFVAFHRARDA